jgi:HAD superfamily hydrolase (TIGR01484 family)
MQMSVAHQEQKIDIDGTIAGESNTINPSVKEAVKAAQNRGVQVAIATGRMYRSALRFHQDIGSNLPLLAYQGAWIQNPLTGQLHRHWCVSPATANGLLDYFEQPQLRNLACTSEKLRQKQRFMLKDRE